MVSVTCVRVHAVEHVKGRLQEAHPVAELYECASTSLLKEVLCSGHVHELAYSRCVVCNRYAYELGESCADRRHNSLVSHAAMWKRVIYARICG